MAATIDTRILEHALRGVEVRRRELDEEEKGIRRQLKLGKNGPARLLGGGEAGGGDSGGAEGSEAPVKRHMSPAAKKRIAIATRKRWAAYRKAKAAGATK